MRGVLAVAGFPFLITVTTLGTVWLLGRGVDPGLAIGPGTLFAFVFLAVAERLAPLHARWLHSQGDLRTDVSLMVTNGVVNALLAPPLLAATTWAAAALSDGVGLGLWPGSWPLLLQLPLALVVAELVEYSAHRAMHEIPWLWRFHATHHSATRLYWLNAARFHPIDVFVVGTVKLVPLALLGASAPVLALVNLFSAVHGAYQHANVPVRLGLLNWVFSMAELHRWHHAPDPTTSNHNYGGNLILWDIVFGTRYLPSDREPPEAVGMAGPPGFPTGYVGNLLAPFRWRRLERAGASAQASRPG